MEFLTAVSVSDQITLLSVCSGRAALPRQPLRIHKADACMLCCSSGICCAQLQTLLGAHAQRHAGNCSEEHLLFIVSKVSLAHMLLALLCSCPVCKILRRRDMVSPLTPGMAKGAWILTTVIYPQTHIP